MSFHNGELSPFQLLACGELHQQWAIEGNQVAVVGCQFKSDLRDPATLYLGIWWLQK